MLNIIFFGISAQWDASTQNVMMSGSNCKYRERCTKWWKAETELEIFARYLFSSSLRKRKWLFLYWRVWVHPECRRWDEVQVKFAKINLKDEIYAKILIVCEVSNDNGHRICFLKRTLEVCVKWACKCTASI